MTHPKQLNTKNYTYHLPPEKIATHPLEKRDSSKLLIHRKDETIIDSRFDILPDILPHNSLLVCNKTKVIHARLIFSKPTGGKIEIFCLEPDAGYVDMTDAMAQDKEVYWHCLVGGASKWKEGVILQLSIPQCQAILYAFLEKRLENSFFIKFQWCSDRKTNISFAEILHHAGNIPLPPYIQRPTNIEDTTNYQTVFAKEEGSVAAPTAALHFSSELLEKLFQKGIPTLELTLHVGAGTFKPIKSQSIAEHEMHSEWMSVELSFLQQLLLALHNNVQITAIGTTSVRSLESIYWLAVRLSRNEHCLQDAIAIPQWYAYDYPSEWKTELAIEFLIKYMEANKISSLSFKTCIMIAPGYQFKMLNHIITNFHQPDSTLLLLVAAFVGKDWLRIYNHALQHNYRFLSYGDACWLIR